MLARLSAAPGIRAAQVDGSGRWFLVEPHDGAAIGRVVEEALAQLGPGASPVDAETAAAELESRGRGEPWFGPGDIRSLSYLEARVLGSRVTDAAATAASLQRAEAFRLGAAVHAELVAALDAVHEEGGRSSSGWIYDAWPAIAGRAVERCAAWLDTERVERVRAALVRQLVRSHGFS